MRMKGRSLIRLFACNFLIAALIGEPVAARAQNTAPAADPGWPREVAKSGATLVYYQPQVDQWKDYREIKGRVAFSLKPKEGKTALGVASIKARTQTDMDARTVVIKTIEITETRFPGLDPTSVKPMDALFRQLFPTAGMTVSLDRLLAAAEKGKSNAKPVHVKSEPPTIFVSETPAILLLVDGEPLYSPIEGTSLEFVINTNWDLFRDKAGSELYLLNEQMWLKAPSLDGPWTRTSTLPADFSKLPAGQNFDDVKALIPPRIGGAPPRVFYSSVPAELVRFEGRPVYVEVPGTRLLYIKNTESDVFLEKESNEFFVLLSGRWFRAKSLQGTWSYAGGDLPKDFATIPAGSPKAHVLASVPGTQEAADAVLLAQIPTTVVVNRKEAEAKVKVVYDGAPKFTPIPTTTMSYATNTQEKVIRVGDLYYLCFQGIWFVSSSPSGPWKTAEMIPASIYTIPPSCPVYSVTYVYVTNPTPTTVECSYTSGYSGMFIVGFAVGTAVVYGSGWYYPPYVYYPPYYRYPIYRPYPYTYGVHAVYNPYTGGYAVGARYYGPYGAAGQSAWYNPATGRYGRAATVQTPYGGRTVASTYNPYTGVRATTRQGSSPYAQWGTTTVQRGNDWAVSQHVTTSQGTVRRTTTSGGTTGTTVRVNGETTRVVKDDDNNVYASHDGNVYKKDSNGDWQKYEDGGWSSVGESPKKASGSQSSTERRSPSTQPSTRETGSKSGGTSSRETPSAQPSRQSGSGSVPSDVQRDASSRQRGSEQSSKYGGGSSGTSPSGSSRGSSRSGGGGGRRR
jgi:hypothetical protein